MSSEGVGIVYYIATLQGVVGSLYSLPLRTWQGAAGCGDASLHCRTAVGRGFFRTLPHHNGQVPIRLFNYTCVL